MIVHARWVLMVALWLWTGLALAGTKYYYYTDPQGTVLAEADAQGNIAASYDYAPYGTQVLGTPPSGPAGYTGHVNDAESGFVYMQARYYDPVGRMLSVDPIGPVLGNVYSFNRYDYASNNPVLNIDPDGRQDCSSACMKMRALSDKFSNISQSLMRQVGGSGAGPGGQMRATMTFINAGATSDIASGLQQAAEATDATISLAPGGSAAICAVDGCGTIGWILAVIAVVPVDGAVESGAARIIGKDLTYLYQKLGAYGEHLKYGIAKNPATRYTEKELGGGKLKILTQGSRQEMLKLERDLHETLPIGPEEGQRFYIQKQVDKGLVPPPYK